jgi:hypothetical protein
MDQPVLETASDLIELAETNHAAGDERGARAALARLRQLDEEKFIATRDRPFSYEAGQP